MIPVYVVGSAMSLKSHKYLPRSKLPRPVWLEVRSELFVNVSALRHATQLVLRARGLVTAGGMDDESPARLTAAGLRSLLLSEATAASVRKAKMVVALGRDVISVEANRKARHARYRAQHHGPTFTTRLDEMLGLIADGRAVSYPRDPLPIAGPDFNTINAVGRGMQVNYPREGGTELIGPCGPDGQILRLQAQYARKAWKLVERGLLQAEPYGMTDTAMVVRIAPTASGAQVAAAATTV